MSEFPAKLHYFLIFQGCYCLIPTKTRAKIIPNFRPAFHYQTQKWYHLQTKWKIIKINFNKIFYYKQSLKKNWKYLSIYIICFKENDFSLSLNFYRIISDMMMKQTWKQQKKWMPEMF